MVDVLPAASFVHRVDGQMRVLTEMVTRVLLSVLRNCSDPFLMSLRSALAILEVGALPGQGSPVLSVYVRLTVYFHGVAAMLLVCCPRVRLLVPVTLCERLLRRVLPLRVVNSEALTVLLTSVVGILLHLLGHQVVLLNLLLLFTLTYDDEVAWKAHLRLLWQHVASYAAALTDGAAKFAVIEPALIVHCMLRLRKGVPYMRLRAYRTVGSVQGCTYRQRGRGLDLIRRHGLELRGWRLLDLAALRRWLVHSNSEWSPILQRARLALEVILIESGH